MRALQSDNGASMTRLQIMDSKNYAEIFRSSDSGQTWTSLGILASKDDLTLKTGTVAVTSYITDGTVYLERAGNVVHLYCRWDLTLTGSPGTGVTLFTVPDGFRPYRTHRTLAQLDYNIGVRQLEIATSGAVSLQGSGAGNATSLLFDAVYFTN